jgi:peptidoglycan/xylan/chitin deacetylase (PgdA/CDA1 family)
MDAIPNRPSLRRRAIDIAARLLGGAGPYKTMQGILGRFAGGFILAYHDLPADVFVLQIESLEPARPVSLAEMVYRLRTGRSTQGLFAITVDDGIGRAVRDIARIALVRSWPVTFYLPTAYLDRERAMPFQWLRGVEPYVADREWVHGVESAMYAGRREDYEGRIQTMVDQVIARGACEDAIRPPDPIHWSEVAELSRHDLLAFESHGVSHTALSALGDEEVERELAASQRRISEHTGRPCRHFCYPYGGPESIGERARALASRHYDSATTMTRGRLGRSSLDRLPRIPLYAGDSPQVARLKTLTL